MTIRAWLKDKQGYFMVHCTFWVSILVFLSVYGFNVASLIFLSIIWALSNGIYLFYDYNRRFKFYVNIQSLLEGLDKKYLIHELIDTPHFYAGQALHDILLEANKSMNDEIAKYKLDQEAYMTYIETWVHEIKTPVAACGLILDNHYNDQNNDFKEELNDISEYIEQVLYYSKTSEVNQDYIIKDVPLENSINKVLRKYSKSLIKKQCSISKSNLNHTVKTDEKWFSFILGQVIKNSIQYANEPMVLEFKVNDHKDYTRLSIIDNGIGIPSVDIDRVFKKGFTGHSGRTIAQSTGMGLYLCKCLSEKMGIHIGIDSNYGEGTTVIIDFPNSSLYKNTI